MGRHKIIEDAQVLSAARKVFEEMGHAASTRDVADAAGISQAVLYQRFGSKEELFFRSMTPVPLDIAALLGSYPPEDAFADLVGIGERLLNYLRAFMPTFLKVLAYPGIDTARLRDWHSRLPFLPLTDALSERFRRMNADGLVSGNPHAASVSFISTIHSLAMFELLASGHERKSRKANLHALLTVLFQGLEPRPVMEPPAKPPNRRRRRDASAPG